MNINEELKKYIDETIFKEYDTNIGGHGIEHILTVIERSFEIIKEFNLDVNYDMVYTIAAFHDIGYKYDPDNHEQLSSEMFLKDNKMKEFFNEEQIKIISEAIVDHRASLEYEARSIYGKIVSSADRAIDVDKMLERSILFQRDKHKDENPTDLEVIDYSYKKLSSKYGKGGYAKMYYPDKKYTDYLERMQEIIEDKNKYIEAELDIMKRLKLFEIILSDNPVDSIKENEEFMFRLIPELETCKNFEQHNEWHVYDVYEHILHVIENVPSDRVLRLTALFHDLGKPKTFTMDENGIGHFRGHWVESQKIFDEFSKKYNLDKNESKLISNLIFYHDANPLNFSEEDFITFIKTFTKEEIELLYIIKRADLLAQNSKYHYLLNEYDKQKLKVLSLGGK